MTRSPVLVKDGHVANRPFYAAIGVSVEGRKDILGLWAGTAGEGEGAKYWLTVLTELKNRGVKDTMFVVCDGLKGTTPMRSTPPGPKRKVQTCVIHLLRKEFSSHLTPLFGTNWPKGLKSVYQAPSRTAAEAAFEEFTTAWNGRYPALIRLWRGRLGRVHTLPRL